jgi:hypothetical protein
VDKVIGILRRGEGVDWDPVVVEALRHVVPRLLTTVYASLAGAAEHAGTEGLDRAA